MGALVPRERRETIIGDVLEEYRQAVAPARGHLRADLWYATQLVRAGWMLAAGFCFLAATFGIWREMLDELVAVSPAGDYRLRAAMLTWAMAGCCVSSGLCAGWRTGGIAAGAITSPVAFACGLAGGAAVSSAFRWLGVASAYSAIEAEATFLVILLVPVVALALTATLGLLGATAGVLLRRTLHRPANT